MILVVHADDIIIAGSDQDCEWLPLASSKAFRVNNLGPLAWFTGCILEKSDECKTDKIVLTAYIEKNMERSRIEKTSPNPTSASVKLTAREEEKE